MAFTAALHTYYRVSDIPNAKVTGLGGVTYLHSLAGSQEVVQQDPEIGFDQEVDRIYLRTPDTIQVCCCCCCRCCCCCCCCLFCCFRHAGAETLKCLTWQMWAVGGVGAIRPVHRSSTQCSVMDLQRGWPWRSRQLSGCYPEWCPSPAVLSQNHVPRLHAQRMVNNLTSVVRMRGTSRSHSAVAERV